MIFKDLHKLVGINSDLQIVFKMNVQTFSGEAAQPFLEDIARLRIAVFAEFPYLYHGEMDYEKAYLQKFLETKTGAIVVVFENGKVIGAATGLPLAAESVEVQTPFLERKMDVSKIFYISELVLLSEFRGHGFGHNFMNEQENFARKNGFEIAVLCAVARPKNHPRCPQNYHPLDDFWIKKGFEKWENFTCQMSWKDWGDENETLKVMQFWGKKL